jgi:hypothetical protein
MLKMIRFISSGVGLLALLSACNLPSGTPDAAATLRAVYTSQAATVQVLQTQAMAPFYSTPMPTLNFPTLVSTRIVSTLTPQPALPTLTEQPSATLTQFPSLTPMMSIPSQTARPTLTKIPSSTPIAYCNWAAFVKDVSYADGAVVAPGTLFTKTWRLKNIGTCTWKTTYGLVFFRGNNMNGIATTDMPVVVLPGKTVDISVVLTAPEHSGKYRGEWLLRNAAGEVFGLGSTASTPFYVEISVSSDIETVFDFTTNYCKATWRSGAGVQACPGNSNSKGYVKRVQDPQLEDGQVYMGPALWVVPQNTSSGYLKGIYPVYKVKKGDHFRSVVSCAYKAKGCSADFRLDYQIGTGTVKTLWEFSEDFDGMVYAADVDLGSLSGKSVKFILTVLSKGSAQYDKVLWVDPRIEHR